MGLFTGCGTSKQAAEPPAAVTDVYVVGFQAPTSNYYIATYWKSGAAVPLADNGTGSNAFSIAVSGNDVYVAGIARYGNSTVATLWHNGTPTPLAGLTSTSVAASVALSGSDVYVAGYETIANPSNNYPVPVVWKNGVVTILDSSTNGGQANSVYVSGGDVYVAGSEEKTTQTAPNTYYTASVATYWKNGVAVALTDGSNAAVATSVFVVGSDVFVGGQNCVIQEPNCTEAVYWKNGSLVTLDAAPATVGSIFISGSDVYASENYGASNGAVVPSYWKDGVQHVLAPASSAATGQISVAGADVYVAGTSTAVQAAYWKNGSQQIVGNYPSAGYGIALVAH